MMRAWTADTRQSSWDIFSTENADLGGVIGNITARGESRKPDDNAEQEVR